MNMSFDTNMKIGEWLTKAKEEVKALKEENKDLREWIKIAIPEVLPLSHKKKGLELLKKEIK